MAKTKPLSVLDMAFFLLESAERMANIGPIAILKPPQDGRSASEFADWLMAQMRLQPVGYPFDYTYAPLSLRGLPRLEKTDDIDLDNHCFRMTLPAPGTQRQLFDLVCDMHVQRLDRSLPLWEFYVIDGLEHGRIALYAKVHHGLIDGLGFIDVCTRWFGIDPKSTDVHAMWQGLPTPAHSDSNPSLIENIKHIARRALGTGLTLGAFTRLLAHQAQKSFGRGKGTPLPFTHTNEAFNAPPSIKRSFAYCKLPVQAMKTFGKQHDATVNDVLLTLLDMAMTRYLDEKHPEQRIRPLQPLVADMPVALGGSEKGGNRIAVLQIPLGAPKANPMRRLEDICEHSREIKDQIRHESAAAMTMHTAAIHAIPALAELLGIKHPPTLANTVISNPFGYPQRCYLGGAEVEMALPMAVLAPGQSLNITAATYDDSLQIAFMGVAKETPDIQLLADYTVAAFDELSASFGDAQTPPSQAKTTKFIRPPAANPKPKRTARK